MKIARSKGKSKWSYIKYDKSMINSPDLLSLMRAMSESRGLTVMKMNLAALINTHFKTIYILTPYPMHDT